MSMSMTAAWTSCRALGLPSNRRTLASFAFKAKPRSQAAKLPGVTAARSKPDGGANRASRVSRVTASLRQA